MLLKNAFFTFYCHVCSLIFFSICTKYTDSGMSDCNWRPQPALVLVCSTSFSHWWHTYLLTAHTVFWLPQCSMSCCFLVNECWHKQCAHLKHKTRQWWIEIDDITLPILLTHWLLLLILSEEKNINNVSYMFCCVKFWYCCLAELNILLVKQNISSS